MAARKKAPEGAVPIEKALLPQDQPERFRLGEMGSLGLNVFNGGIWGLKSLSID